MKNYSTNNIILEERQVPWKTDVKYAIDKGLTLSHHCQFLQNKVRAVQTRLYPFLARQVHLILQTN